MELSSVIRRWHSRDHCSIREISRRTGLSRNTVRKSLRSDSEEPKFSIPDRPSKLDPHADKLSHMLRQEAGKSRKQKRTIKQLQLGCRRSLIGSLAAMSHLEAWRLDRLPLDRHPIHVGDEVHHVASDDRDARLMHLGHFPSLSMFGAAAMASMPLVSGARREFRNELR